MTLEEAAKRLANANKNFIEIDRQYEASRKERESLETKRDGYRTELMEAQTDLLKIAKES